MGDACGAVLAADQSTSAVGIRAAAVMAVTGVGLLTVAPGNSILTGAGWIWPPLMFALAVWMGVQLRRALTGRVRWLLYPVIAALAGRWRWRRWSRSAGSWQVRRQRHGGRG
jgi:hypothetical protein